MALTRCKKGHFYDGRKYLDCPFCGVDLSGAAFKGVPINHSGAREDLEEVTVAAGFSDDDCKTVGNDDVDEESKTIGIYECGDVGLNGTMPAGWLVCIEGPERGRDYRIHAGNNQIGRSLGMEINLADAYVSRKNHARIIYDPVSNSFFIMAGESTEVECNGNTVRSAMPLHDRDKIRLGGSLFVFVAFCKEGMMWNYEA